MAVRVLIEREILPGKEGRMVELLYRLRRRAMKQDGYISGQTLYAVDNPRRVLVISTWRSLEDWSGWAEDPVRTEIEEKVNSILIAPASYRVYSYM